MIRGSERNLKKNMTKKKFDKKKYIFTIDYETKLKNKN